MSTTQYTVGEVAQHQAGGYDTEGVLSAKETAANAIITQVTETQAAIETEARKEEALADTALKEEQRAAQPSVIDLAADTLGVMKAGARPINIEDDIRGACKAPGVYRSVLPGQGTTETTGPRLQTASLSSDDVGMAGYSLREVHAKASDGNLKGGTALRASLPGVSPAPALEKSFALRREASFSPVGAPMAVIGSIQRERGSRPSDMPTDISRIEYEGRKQRAEAEGRGPGSDRDKQFIDTIRDADPAQTMLMATRAMAQHPYLMHLNKDLASGPKGPTAEYLGGNESV